MSPRRVLVPATLVGLLVLMPHSVATPPCGTDAVCDETGDAEPTRDVWAAWVDNIGDGTFDLVLEVDEVPPVGPAVSVDDVVLVGADLSYVVGYCFDPRGQAGADQVCYSVWAQPTVTGWKTTWFAVNGAGNWHCPPIGESALEAFTATAGAEGGDQLRWRVTASLHDLHHAPPATCGPMPPRGTVGDFVGGSISCLEAFTTAGASAGVTGIFTIVDEAGGCDASPTWNVKP